MSTLVAQPKTQPLKTPHWLDPYHFDLPPERIAQHPLAERDASRLMVLQRGQAGVQHEMFQQLPNLLPRHSLVIANDVQVEPRRLVGHLASGGLTECLLLERQSNGSWRALVRNARRLKEGSTLVFAQGNIRAHALAPAPQGGWFLQFEDEAHLPQRLQRYGLAPLPPYIRRNLHPAPAPNNLHPSPTPALEAQHLSDRQAYQTCYAKTPGASAAPTAGLHFTPRVMAALQQRSCQWHTLTLQVGEGTFAPILAESAHTHRMHQEWLSISPTLAQEVLRAKVQGHAIIAIGTTSVRALETWWQVGASPQGYAGWSDLFIQPGFAFEAVDGLLTNFHLPRTTLMLLVSAFHGTKHMLQAYHQAIAQGYRFYSFGDCMLVLPAKNPSKPAP